MATDVTASLFVWQVQEADGSWGTIAFAMPPLFRQPTPLVATSLARAQALGLVAVAHHDVTGKPIRLVHFIHGDIIRQVP